MFYLFHGSDLEKVKTKADQLVASLLDKKPNVSLFKFNRENWQQNIFEESISGQTLFDKKYLVVGAGVLGNKEALEFLIANIDGVVASPNIFIFYEDTLPSEVLSQIIPKANKVVTFDSLEKKKKPDFNIFSLADSLGTKDRRGLWLSFMKARLAGIAPEEIFWQFYRQVKNMILVSSGQDLDLLKMHPFVVKKTTSAASKFSQTQLKTMFSHLVDIYSSAHSGQVDLDIALEQFVLEI